MKTLILMVILVGATAYTQVTNYITKPPLNKTLNEVIKAEKIDTSKSEYSNGVMLMKGRIEGDSTDILYKFDLENRLVMKGYGIYLRGSTGKSALKKFRAVNQKIAANYGKPTFSEGMQDSPVTDTDKLYYLSKGNTLISQYETDSFYILIALLIETESGIHKVLISYITPEEWNIIRNSN